MSKNRSRSESSLEGFKQGTIVLIEVPKSRFVGEVGEQNSDVGIVVDKSSVEISKTEE